MGYKTQLQSRFAHTRGEFVPGYNSEFPAHPAIVHYPIAFNMLAWSIDVLYAMITTVFRPSYLTSRYGNQATLSDLSRLSYFLLCVGILTSVPAIMSGNVQLLAIISKNGGIWEKEADGEPKQTVVPRIKAAITHALMNDFIFVVNVYNWHLRRTRSYGGTTANAPSSTNMLISLTLIPLFMAASKIGGTLVFNHGIGLNLGRKQLNADVKDI